MAQKAAANSLLIATAAHGLRLLSAPADPIAAIPPGVWKELLVASEQERLVFLLERFLADNQAQLDDEQRSELRTACERNAARLVFLEAHLLRIAGSLDEAGIPYRVLKGPALAHLDYEHPGDRCWIDIDLLVPSRCFDAAVRLLTRLGCRRQFPEPRRGFDRRFGKGTSFDAPDGYEIDLHRTWVSGPYAHLIDIDAVAERCAWVDVGGVALPTLCREDRVLHACFHATVGNHERRLLPLRDLRELLRRPFDVEVVRRRAAAWRADAVLAAAVDDASDVLGIERDDVLGADLRQRPRSAAEQRLLRAYAGGSYAVEVAAALGSIRGATARGAYLRALLLPDVSYVSGRYRSRLGRLREGAAAVTTWWRSSRSGP